ncbi:DUF5320 domain-containing protein [Teichococcus cervicalis]|uniref:DUF5320 domain-containing protein n=1 Tax=Teichococcus cervicalis TaxID=204525 RepID=UPI0002D6167A|nr:DUF5320 domain-containing protein [Pseudoroseomonas cervicalis]
MSRGSSGRILSIGQKLSTALAEPDRQADGLRNLSVAPQEFVDEFHRLFAGTGVLQDQDKVRAATVLYNTLRNGAARQIELYVQMGKALLAAERKFAPEEWKLLIDRSDTLFKVPKNRAVMWRQVALAVEEGRLPLDLLPDSYSVAYVFTHYEPQRIQKAIEAGVLRPSVTRKEAEHFRRLPLTGQNAGPPPAAELDRLLEQERRLEEKLVAIRARIAELRRGAGALAG